MSNELIQRVNTLEAQLRQTRGLLTASEQTVETVCAENDRLRTSAVGQAATAQHAALVALVAEIRTSSLATGHPDFMQRLREVIALGEPSI